MGQNRAIWPKWPKSAKMTEKWSKAVIEIGNQQFHTEVDYGSTTFSDWTTGNRVDIDIDYSRIIWLSE